MQACRKDRSKRDDALLTRALGGAPQLLALDLDGTLIDRSLVITPRVKAAVREARDRGIPATLVTGRMFAAARRYAAELEIEAPIICYQGAAVYEPIHGTLLREVALPHDVAIRVLRRAKADGYHVQLYHDDHFYVDDDNAFAELYAEISQVRPTVVPSLEAEFAGRDSTKCNIVTTPERAARYVDTVRAVCGDDAYVTRSNPEFIEVMNRGVDKGEALSFVAEHIGVSLDSVLAIGDSYNDLPLLRAAGFGVAMGSSPDAVQSAADAVVGDYAHDGVAEAIERFALALVPRGSAVP